jgi:hypothetical protein
MPLEDLTTKISPEHYNKLLFLLIKRLTWESQMQSKMLAEILANQSGLPLKTIMDRYAEESKVVRKYFEDLIYQQYGKIDLTDLFP